MSLPFPYEGVVIATGLLAGLSGLRDLIYDVLYIPGRSLEATYYVGMVGLYLGVALMAAGAPRPPPGTRGGMPSRWISGVPSPMVAFFASR
mgnify:CR=1 FL=1